MFSVPTRNSSARLFHLQKKAIFKLRIASCSKASTALHLEVVQNGKLCLSGYITMTNMSAPTPLSIETGWQLTPSLPPVSLKDLEVDAPSNWSGYLTPFDPLTYRKPQSYARYFVPIERTHQNYIDQWVTPSWKDDLSPKGAVWTNETVHFIVDNSLPIINDLVTTEKSDTYRKIVRAGLLQKQAHLEGKDDRMWGPGLSDHEILLPWIISTVSTSTEVKRLLPKEGCKWLFMRNSVKSVVNNRMDLEIVLMNEKMELIALSQHVCQIIHVDSKREKKANL